MHRILIVDDQKKIRRIYASLLSSEGFSVMSAENADAANEIMKRHDVDLVLLDLKMPEATGGELYEVMTMFRRPCKVIVASVYPTEEQRRVVCGANDYYDKSQSSEILLSKIRKVLVQGG